VAPNLTLPPDSLEMFDHIGAADLVFQFHDAAFDEALLLLGRVIFGILRQVAMGARFRDRLDDLMAIFVLQALSSSSRALKPEAVMGDFSIVSSCRQKKIAAPGRPGCRTRHLLKR